MNREILFRGKTFDTKEWVYGAFVPYALDGSNDLVSWAFIRNYNKEIGHMQTIEVDKETVGQFTGWTDKNKIKLFEGDILRNKDKHHKIIGIIKYGKIPNDLSREEYIGFYIYWMNENANEWNSWLRSDLNYWINSGECDLIGNIYDHPELMEESE